MVTAQLLAGAAEREGALLAAGSWGWIVGGKEGGLYRDGTQDQKRAAKDLHTQRHDSTQAGITLAWGGGGGGHGKQAHMKGQ